MTDFQVPDRLLQEVRKNMGLHLHGVKVEACDSIKWVVRHKSSCDGFVEFDDVAINREGRAVVFGHSIIRSERADNCGRVIVDEGSISLRITPRQLRRIRQIENELRGNEMFEISAIEFVDEP